MQPPQYPHPSQFSLPDATQGTPYDRLARLGVGLCLAGITLTVIALLSTASSYLSAGLFLLPLPGAVVAAFAGVIQLDPENRPNAERLGVLGAGAALSVATTLALLFAIAETADVTGNLIIAAAGFSLLIGGIGGTASGVLRPAASPAGHARLAWVALGALILAIGAVLVGCNGLIAYPLLDGSKWDQLTYGGAPVMGLGALAAVVAGHLAQLRRSQGRATPAERLARAAALAGGYLILGMLICWLLVFPVRTIISA